MSQIWAITQFIERRKGAFGISTLILRSGVRVREYTADSHDEEAELRRVLRALPELLDAQEFDDLRNDLSRSGLKLEEDRRPVTGET